jgi:uncharacterized protein YegP (UPF0339 family)
MQSSFPTFWVFRDKAGLWHWKFAVEEGGIAAASCSGFDSLGECADAIRQLQGAHSVALFGNVADLGGETSTVNLPAEATAQSPSLSGDDKVDWGSPVVDVTPLRR